MYNYFIEQIEPLNEELGTMLNEAERSRYEAEQEYRELQQLREDDMRAEGEIMEEEERLGL